MRGLHLHWQRIAAAVGAALLVAGCQSASTSSVEPSGQKCSLTVSTTVPSISASGGSGSLEVSVAPECVWEAASESDWITLTSSTSNQGPNVVTFEAAPNPTALIRRGSVRLGETRLELTQVAAPCRFSLDPDSEEFGVEGGDGVVSVATLEGCEWTATSGASWLSVNGDAPRNGNGDISYRVEANSGADRTGVLTIAGRVFVVNQRGVAAPAPPPPCTTAFERREGSIDAAGGEDEVAVASTGDCPWNAASDVPWIQITSGASGSGNGLVRLQIDANPGGPRVGSVTIGDDAYTVNQAGAACAYAIDPLTQDVTFLGGEFGVEVTTASHCTWTASSSEEWIALQDPATGEGSGTVRYVVPVAVFGLFTSRTGTITISGETMTITQVAPLE
ncbi:MAG: BACON domain-containing carbohydrate-binding protein [Vicinamibacterales bacterium]